MTITAGDRRRAQARYVSSLQSALDVREVQRAYLGTAADLVGGLSTGFYQLDPETGHPTNCVSNAPEDFLAEYEQLGRQDDPVLTFVKDRLRPIDSSRIRSNIWQDSEVSSVLQKVGYWHSLQAPVIAFGVVCGTINFARGEQDSAFDSADLRCAFTASQQLGLALERAIRHEQTGHRASLYEDVLDRLPQAVLLNDLERGTIFANRAASAPGVQESPSIAETVHDRVAETIDEFRLHGTRTHTDCVHDSENHRRLIVRSSRLPDRAGAILTFVYASADTDRTRLPAWEVLTPREQQIAALVSEGLTTREIARRSFVSENTVKQHLKRIFAKTEVRNRAELLQRIWSQSHADPAAPPD